MCLYTQPTLAPEMIDGLAHDANFKVGNFPADTEGIQIFTKMDLNNSSNHKIASWIFAKGGACLKLWGIRWEEVDRS